MSLTRDDVLYAYRLILGREPENEEVIEQTMQAESLAHLRRVFMGSAEFASKYAGAKRALPVGRFSEADRVDVDLACTPEQLQAMFDRIGTAWQAFGESEPHWSVLSSDDYLQAHLPENVDRFFRRGELEVDIHLNALRRAGLSTRFGRVLDFGCGVGRLTLALSPQADQVIGVDISPPHLRLAEERASQVGIANVLFEAIAAIDDLDRYRGFDLVISLIVLQHNPPPVMAALYARLLAALAPGGVAIVQMPTFIKDRSFSTTDYLANEQPQMEMNALPQHHVFDIVDAAGCRVVEVREDVAAGDMPALSHTFVVRKL